MREGIVDYESDTLCNGRFAMFEITYNLRMREGAECGGSPWLQMRGVICNLSGTGDKFY